MLFPYSMFVFEDNSSIVYQRFQNVMDMKYEI